MSKTVLTQKVLIYELVGFACVIVLLWLTELIDLPHALFGVSVTPVNWIESLVESSVVAVFGLGTILITLRLIRRIKFLEGILPICSFCKRIRVKEDWVVIEKFISGQSEAVFSHGVCPQCMKEQYGYGVKELKSRDLEKQTTNDTNKNESH